MLVVNPGLKNVTPENVAVIAPINNPVVINNPTQTNPNHTVDTGNHSQPTNPIVINNPTQTNPTHTVDTGNHTQPTNPVVINNPTQTNPTHIIDTGNHTHPTNPVAINTPTQTNPTHTNPVAVTNPIHNPTQTNPVAVTNPALNLTEKINEIKELPTSPYSNRHPIPINPPLPEGLIYKVQIGAFSKPIRQNAFKGLEPITGETVGTGLTRYTAGIFKDFNKAKGAQTQVRLIGYKDAFIVAFYNGKRISIRDAAALQNGTQSQPTNPVAINNPTQNPTQTNPVHTTDTGNHAQQTNPVVSTPVTDVKGIFYTVQVGAFKTTVTAAKLYNLSPLFSYHASNGYIRYNCGIYSNVPNASSAKDAIVSKTPIKDAFVVAYYNGDRIELIKAAQMLSSGAAVIAKNPGIDATSAGTNGATNPQHVNTSVQTPDNNPTVTQSTEISHLDKKSFDTAAFPEGSIFSVQIANFKGDLTTEQENIISEATAGKRIIVHRNDDGSTMYSIGKYADYKAADSLKGVFINEDLTTAKVIEF
ncbi:MAG TPA: hypothetical protein VK890_02730, partial [Bacteroidia bacterium]|nr:hypothetical protein [Bacteroidia bacterium]